jgi:cysteine synthase
VVYAANIHNSVLDMIGNSPMIKINKMHENKKVNIYAKFEGNNPGGSIKDRIALSMIEAAEKNQELTKEKTILEATSGNTGIGLAMIATIKGYNITLTMSEAVSEERKKILRAYGATIIQTPAEFGTDGAIRKAHEIYEQNKEKYWMSNQFNNPNNPLAHYNTTAVEIINQLPEITTFVIAIGTSGTLMGTSKRLKEYNKNIQVIAIEPSLGHKVQGLKNMKEAIVPKIYNEKAYDKKITITDEEAYETARLLAKKEGLFVGMSTGAAMAGAIKTAEKMKEGNIVVIFPDRGEKYLSTILFN